MKDEENGEYTQFIKRFQFQASLALHRTVPLTTKRSLGLDPQYGLVVGALFNKMAHANLFTAVNRLPGVWKPRGPEAIHYSFGVVRLFDEDPAGTTLRDYYNQVAGRAHGHFISTPLVSPALTSPVLRVRNDAIVLHGVPNPEAYRLRRIMLESLNYLGIPIEEHLGDIVIAEASRPLTDQEHESTDDWLQEAAGALVPCAQVPLQHALVSSFSVVDERLALAAGRREATFFIK
jgi:hypothetical protein